MSIEVNVNVNRRMEHDIVRIDDLKEADSPRLHGEDPEHIRTLAESETMTPPILVHRQTMRVIDGMHRLRAAKLNGRTSIEVEFFDGTDAEAFLWAVEVNTTHGLPLSIADRKAAARRIFATHPDMSNRAIAKCAGLSDKTVAAIRSSSADIPHLNNRRGGDGRRRPLDASAGRLRAAEVITHSPELPLREVAKEAGISLGTAKDVRDRLARGVSAVPRRARERKRLLAAQGRKRPAYEDSAAQEGSPENGTTAVVVDSATRSYLARLGRDPAIRSTDAGRELLRWLNVNEAALRKWPELLSAVPAHCTDLVAGLMQKYSTSWECLLEDLEKKAQTIFEK